MKVLRVSVTVIFDRTEEKISVENIQTGYVCGFGTQVNQMLHSTGEECGKRTHIFAHTRE